MKTKIISNAVRGTGYFDMEFEAGFAEALPGQFIMMRVGDSRDPLLRRPMSIAGFKDGICRVICKVVGRGTQLLSGKNPGDAIDVLGPFGNSFQPPKNANHILLVAGGIGVAPLLFFAKRNPDKRYTVLIGGRTKNDILAIDDFQSLRDVHISATTEDGTMGTKGLVTTLLHNQREFERLNQVPGFMLACGPKPMLKAMDEIVNVFGWQGELSLEERMGCGFGVCLGCVVDTVGGRKRMCVDGPVFKTGSVKWQI